MPEFPDKTQVEKDLIADKKIKPLVTGAVQVPRPATRRFLDFIFAESPKDLAKRIAASIVVPRIKSGFEEAFNGFLHGMLWGSNVTNGNPTGSAFVQQAMMRGGGMNYAAISASPQAMVQQAIPQQRSSGNYRDIRFMTQQQAELILHNLYGLLNQYNVVAVGDLYEMCSITPAISDNAYGWNSFDGARIRPANDGGYLLELPQPHLI